MSFQVIAVKWRCKGLNFPDSFIPTEVDCLCPFRDYTEETRTAARPAPKQKQKYHTIGYILNQTFNSVSIIHLFHASIFYLLSLFISSSYCLSLIVIVFNSFSAMPLPPFCSLFSDGVSLSPMVLQFNLTKYSGGPMPFVVVVGALFDRHLLSHTGGQVEEVGRPPGTL